MALDWILPEPGPALNGQRVRLRAPRTSDYAVWAELRQASRPFLQPWEPTWPLDDLTRGAFRRRMQAGAHDVSMGAAYPFLVFRRDDGNLTGGVTLSNIRRGVSQTASVGYWCGAPFVRCGLTLDAVRTVVDFAFERVGLHRLEAACVPENVASEGLLLKAGFRREGEGRDYLKINGEWRDHVLFGLLRSDARGVA